MCKVTCVCLSRRSLGCIQSAVGLTNVLTVHSHLQNYMVSRENWYELPPPCFLWSFQLWDAVPVINGCAGYSHFIVLITVNIPSIASRVTLQLHVMFYVILSVDHQNVRIFYKWCCLVTSFALLIAVAHCQIFANVQLIALLPGFFGGWAQLIAGNGKA